LADLDSAGRKERGRRLCLGSSLGRWRASRARHLWAGKQTPSGAGATSPMCHNRTLRTRLRRCIETSDQQRAGAGALDIAERRRPRRHRACHRRRQHRSRWPPGCASTGSMRRCGGRAGPAPARPSDAARKARFALQQLAEGRQVTCTIKTRDQYRRAVSVCSVGGGSDDIGRDMVRAREAAVYARGERVYDAEEQEARAARRGIWAGTFQHPGGFQTRAGNPAAQQQKTARLAAFSAFSVGARRVRPAREAHSGAGRAST
jgi:hypothetical protein